MIDNFSSQSEEYSKFRPTYPKKMYEWLVSNIECNDLAIDFATGNGQNAVGLSEYFVNVIGIDISQVIYGTGVSNYTKGLVRHLLLNDKENEYILFGSSLRRHKDLVKFINSLDGKFESKIYRFPPLLLNFFWNVLHVVNIEILIGKVDIFHSSDWTQPPTKAKKVTTVHDLVPWKYPRFTHKNISSAHLARLKWVAKEIDRVIVPSRATETDLLGLGFTKEKIRVIPEAAAEFYTVRGSGEIEEVKKKYAVNGNYLLIVGTSPRKNISKAIEAYFKSSAGKDLKLVIVGQFNGQIKAERGIRVLGYVPDKDMPALYSGAAALIYPSLYEGFGLTILEAFSCGCPVVTSNVSSMPEVAEGAAVLVDPTSVESISEGISKALAGRVGLIKKGLLKAQEYSWEKAAMETLSVYKELVK